MKYTVYAAGKELTAVISEDAISVDGVKVIRGSILTGNYVELIVNGKRYKAFYQAKGALSGEVYIDNRIIPVTIEPENVRRAREILGVNTGGTNKSVLQVISPMPGLIAKITVQEHSHVSVGDRLCVLEAMKMENELRATENGTISRVFVKERDTVEKGKPLIEIKLT
ncbi:MAG TPA: acetyl-CoA carboxylase biotin carboxyl carrier protein subunit [Candidatus Kapabacteria bacterium]|nr:acetyl-CoA carboxylase biotin carboxyl carrier protein subunit [Candidatus Kapabacteria bacterium]